jgi:hypothetical protein
MTQSNDVLEIFAIDGDLLGLGSWSENEVVVFVLAGRGGDFLLLGVDASDSLCMISSEYWRSLRWNLLSLHGSQRQSRF